MDASVFFGKDVRYAARKATCSSVRRHVTKALNTGVANHLNTTSGEALLNVIFALLQRVAPATLARWVAKEAVKGLLITAAVEYAGNYSSFVKEHKEWIITTVYLVPGSYSKTALAAFASAGGRLKAGLASISPRMFCAVALSEMSRKVIRSFESIASSSTVSGRFVSGKAWLLTGEMVEVIFDLRTKAFKYVGSDALSTLMLAGSAVGGLAAFYDANDVEKKALLEEYSRSCVIAMRSKRHEMDILSASAWLRDLDPIRLIGAPRALAEELLIRWPGLSREAVAALITRVSLADAEREDRLQITTRKGFSPSSGEEFLRVGGLYFSVSKENASLVPLASEPADVLDAPAPKASAYLTAIIDLFLYLEDGGSPHLRKIDDGVYASPPVMNGDVGVRIIAQQAAENGLKVDSLHEMAKFFSTHSLSVDNGFLSFSPEKVLAVSNLAFTLEGRSASVSDTVADLFGSDLSFDEDNDLLTGDDMAHWNEKGESFTGILKDPSGDATLSPSSRERVILPFPGKSPIKRVRAKDAPLSSTGAEEKWGF